MAKIEKGPLAYLMTELGLKAADWRNIDDATKDTLKTWAAEEIAYINGSEAKKAA